MKIPICGRFLLLNCCAKRKAAAGFTLLELAVIAFIVGILAAGMAPSFVGFLERQRLNRAHELVHQTIRTAQVKAKLHCINWQASFREQDGVVQLATHSASTPPENAVWTDLDPSVQLDSETTLQLANKVRRVRFDQEGRVNGQLGRLTLSLKSGGKAKRCVIVSTLLGAMRQGEEHPTKQNDKYCY